MKRIILAALLLVAMVLTFASCGKKPELDFDDAEKNLKGEDYEVQVIDDDDLLPAGMVEVLRAEDDNDNELYIATFETAKYAKIQYKILKQEHEAEIEATELQIKQIEYMLKHFDGDLESAEIDKYEDKLKNLEKELEELKEDWVIGIKGKTVWYGTADAVEDSRK